MSHVKYRIIIDVSCDYTDRYVNVLSTDTLVFCVLCWEKHVVPFLGSNVLIQLKLASTSKPR